MLIEKYRLEWYRHELPCGKCGTVKANRHIPRDLGWDNVDEVRCNNKKIVKEELNLKG